MKEYLTSRVPWLIMTCRVILILLNVIFVAPVLQHLQDAEEQDSTCIYCDEKPDSECMQKVNCNKRFGDHCYFYRKGDLVWKGCGGCDVLGKKGTQCCRGKLCNLVLQSETQENLPKDNERFKRTKEFKDEHINLVDAGKERKARQSEKASEAGDTKNLKKDAPGNSCIYCDKKLDSECNQKLRCYSHFGDSCYTYKSGAYVWKGCGCQTLGKVGTKCCTGKFCNQEAPVHRDIRGPKSSELGQELGNYCMYCHGKASTECTQKLHCYKRFSDSCYAYEEGGYLWKGCGCSMLKKGTKCCEGEFCNHDLIENLTVSKPNEGFGNNLCYVCGKTSQFRCITTMICHLRFGQYCYTYSKEGHFWYGCGCPTYTTSTARQRCCAGKYCNRPREDVFSEHKMVYRPHVDHHTHRHFSGTTQQFGPRIVIFFTLSTCFIVSILLFMFLMSRRE